MAPSISAKDSQGFWGRPTSTIDWCEYNYEVKFKYFKNKLYAIFTVGY